MSEGSLPFIKNHINLFVFIGMQWLFEQLRNRNVKCYKSPDRKCRRHYLNDIKTVKFSSNGEDWPINIDNWRNRKQFYRRNS
ncbi:hypothetical protein WN944_022361 [Citrus x changshan-huyou]|uniref:Uncharacterized protein n=1 Tax=Citrus x changshan-huyou TaxID=2935761 RepID=A0AAP0N4F6_9ROSI